MASLLFPKRRRSGLQARADDLLKRVLERRRANEVQRQATAAFLAARPHRFSNLRSCAGTTLQNVEGRGSRPIGLFCSRQFYCYSKERPEISRIMISITQLIVNQAWNFARVLRDDGLSYMVHITPVEVNRE